MDCGWKNIFKKLDIKYKKLYWLIGVTILQTAYLKPV